MHKIWDELWAAMNAKQQLDVPAIRSIEVVAVQKIKPIMDCTHREENNCYSRQRNTSVDDKHAITETTISTNHIPESTLCVSKR